MSTVSKPRPNRLLALDILRGITIAGMILVNNPGSWGHIYAPLAHAEWNGLTPTDLVFPFFMFIMGVSTYFSLRKFNFELTWACAWKIIRRTIVIFAIGLGIAWFGRFLGRITGEASFWEAVMNFDQIRILGVMPRLALCYGIGSFVALICGKKVLPWVVAAMLVAYAIILLTGDGFAFASHNVIARVDTAVLGEAHMYSDTVGGVRLKFDPEGLLSTLPSIAHMLIGFICGGMLLSVKDNNLRINKLFIIGTILTFSGFLLDFGMPINKKIWSPTFVLTTCGLASLLLGVLIWAIDIKGHRRWCQPFEVFGINPLFLYTIASVLSILFNSIHWPMEGMTGSVHNVIYALWLKPMCAPHTELASLLYALIFVSINWAVGLILYKKKIYIKI